MRTWIHLSSEAQSAARWQAQHGYDGSVGTPLPNLLSMDTLKEINGNLALFKLAVHINKTFN